MFHQNETSALKNLFHFQKSVMFDNETGALKNLFHFQKSVMFYQNETGALKNLFHCHLLKLRKRRTQSYFGITNIKSLIFF